MNYCTGTINLGDRIRVEGADINEGLKVSISNYKKGEDQLSFETTINISGQWDESTGTLILSGKASAADYQQALRNVTYTNLSQEPTNGTRSISVTLKDVDYLPYTGHFYKYISQRGISWTDAKAAAQAMNYYGLQGYLGTITSAQENDFVWTKIRGVGWIGASDAAVEGDWKWETGPEAETLFWKGDFTGNAVNSEYSDWNYGEPNNINNEDYAHINQDPNSRQKSWNDLPNAGSGIQYYIPQGYIVEFGGMPGDPAVSLFAVIHLNVWNIQFDSKVDQTICEGEKVQLNHEFAGNYEWYPKTGLDDPYRSDPIASPVDSIIYTVISKNGSCVDSAHFMVNVKPRPQLELGNDVDLCEGDTVLLNAGTQSFYQWNTGDDQQTLAAVTAGKYVVLVANSYNCFARDSVQVAVHSYPQVDLSQLETLFCDQKIGAVQVAIDKGKLTWQPFENQLSFDDSNAEQTTVRTSEYGNYHASLNVVDAYGCQTLDTVNFSFHKTPTAEFNIDSTTCYGYYLGVHYLGDGTANARYNWFFADSIYASGIGLTNLNVNLGFNQSGNRQLGLMVDEGGCGSPGQWKHIKVTPNVQIKTDVDEGCQPFPVQFTTETTEPISSFTWYFGDGDSLKQSNPSHTYQLDGVYDVGLRVVSNEGCENFGLMKNLITVHPVPTTETSLDPDSCYSHTFSVHYTGSANPQDIYHWDFSQIGAQEVVSDPGTGPGPFDVSLKNQPTASIGLQITSEYGCESESKTFSFKRKPWFQLVSDVDEGCPPLDVQLSALQSDSVDNLSYLWQFGSEETFQDGAEQLVHRFNTPDHNYLVAAIGKSSITGCSDTVSLALPIKVFPKPIAKFRAVPDRVTIVDPQFSFQNGSVGAQNYSWDFGDSIGYSSEKEPIYQYKKMGWYNVKLTAENSLSCTDTATHRVLVAFDKIFPPNAFNPNSSIPKNKTFLLAPIGIAKDGYLMQIYNRWGERIFEAKDDFIPWDGKMANGQPAPAGVYTWVIGYIDFAGEKHNQSGKVTLIY